MTKHIPEVKGVEGLLRRLWSRVQEPRVLSFLAWTIHIVLAVIGGAFLFNPPAVLTAYTGSVAAVIASSTLTLGGALGAVGSLPGWQLTERLGLFAEASSLSLLLVMLSHTGVVAGAMWILAGLTYVALSWMLSRWIRIKDHVFEPGSKAEAKAIRDNPSIRADTGSIPITTEP